MKRQKVFFIIFSSILLFSSCKKKEDKIEIYLTKERIESNDGVSIKDFYTEEKLQNLPDYSIERINNLINKNVRIDTLREYRNIIYCGNFKANFEELERNPIINDSEIINFNTKKSAFKFDNSVLEKLSKIELDTNYIGKQFAVCINKKPIMFGYILNSFENYYSENYFLDISNTKFKNLHENDKVTSFLHYGKDFRPLDTSKEKEFIKALKNTNRLVQE